MHGAGVPHEVRARPGMEHEELDGQQVTLHPVAAGAGEHEVAWRVRSAVGQRMDVIERCGVEVEGRGAVHAAAAAVTHGGALHGALVTGSSKVGDGARMAAPR